ncbi:MAG: SGNH/GDSL hydrolase family protein [Elusimicrobia bacterium]|nr:SGNH/GDSL hydrolase family protein [Elusimicrobiota bacterium]
MTRILRRLGWCAVGFLALALAVEAGCRLFLLYRNRLAPKPGAFELYALGGSAMAGTPYERGVSIPDIAAKLLNGTAGGLPIRVINLAAHGETIYPQSFKLERAVRYRDRSRPGAVFIYAGHNDAAFSRAPASRLCRVFVPLKEAAEARSVALSLLAFHGERLRLLPVCRGEEVFERYMRRAVAASKDAGLTPVLSAEVSNMADIEPGLWLGGDTAVARRRLASLLDEGERLEREGRWSAAVGLYDAAADEFPTALAYLGYRIGKCRAGQGDYPAARRRFQGAVDAVESDSFGRARSSQHAFLRDLAEASGTPRVDAAAIFERHSPHGLLGDGLFADGHHPNLRGYALLAEGFSRALAAEHGFPEPGAAPRAPELERWLSMDAERRVEALLSSGRWLFTVSVRHERPRTRLGLAEKRFREAVALSPGDRDAWLGLALVTAARRSPAMLQEEGEISWLERRGLFYGARYRVPPDELPVLLSRLLERGVPRELLDRVGR